MCHLPQERSGQGSDAVGIQQSTMTSGHLLLYTVLYLLVFLCLIKIIFLSNLYYLLYYSCVLQVSCFSLNSTTSSYAPVSAHYPASIYLLLFPLMLLHLLNLLLNRLLSFQLLNCLTTYLELSVCQLNLLFIYTFYYSFYYYSVSSIFSFSIPSTILSTFPVSA